MRISAINGQHRVVDAIVPPFPDTILIEHFLSINNQTPNSKLECKFVSINILARVLVRVKGIDA
jgi:hypothetical protein